MLPEEELPDVALFVQCDDCDRLFRTREEMLWHVAKTHSTDDGPSDTAINGYDFWLD